MTRAISKYAYLFMDEVAGAIYLHDHYKMSKIQQFFKRHANRVMIYYITVLWVHKELVVPTLLILLVFKKMRIFLPLSAPKWPPTGHSK